MKPASAVLPLDWTTIESALILKPSSLGDIVHTLPALMAIKAQAPQARIHWLSHPSWIPLLEAHPAIDHVIPFPREELRGLRGLTRWWPWTKVLRTLPIDIALDFQGLLRTALMARLTPAKWSAGMDDAREGAPLFYQLKIPIERHRHALDRNLAFVRGLGIEHTNPSDYGLPQGTLPTTPLPEHFLLLHPYARGADKSLCADLLAHLCHLLAPLPIVIVGRGNPLSPSALPASVVDLTNSTTLLELIALIRAAHFTLSVDSGPMHLAAALTDQLLSLHTWSDPRRVGPHCPLAWIWKSGKMQRVCDYRPTAPPPSQNSQGFQKSDIPPIASWIKTRF